MTDARTKYWLTYSMMETVMRKLAMMFCAGVLTLSVGASAFAADTAKTEEPAKAVAAKVKKEKPVVPAAKKSAKKEASKTEVPATAK
jgi:hypothetical protein